MLWWHWFTLSEVSQKLQKIRDVWRQAVYSSRRESYYAEMEDSRKKSAQQMHRCNSTKPDRFCDAPTPARRKGVANGRTLSRRPSRQLSSSDLKLPFMDTGLFHGGAFDEYDSTASLGHTEPKSPDQNNEQISQTVSHENTVNMFKVSTEDRNNGIFTRMFHHLSFILQRNTTINYPDVSEQVLASDRVKTAIKTAVMEELKGQDPDDAQILISQFSHKQRAGSILQDMRSCISAFLLKIAAWVIYKLLGRMLDGIEVHKAQVDVIKRASQNNVPIIYLPLHRSHLDYILVTFILYMNDIRAPLVAAGNNLMIPFFGSLLRGLGAFFIKRKLDPQHGQRDFVYRAVLHTYMEKSLTYGHSMEFFIEGGRSRTGKAVLPKAGLLSIVVDTLLSGGIQDAYIVPIAMSYEKLLDGNFVSEQLGKPKKMESFHSAVQAIWRTLHSNFGTVRIDFCQPFSLKEFLHAAEYSYSQPSRNMLAWVPKQNNCFMKYTANTRRRSEYGSEIVLEDHRQVIKDLADYVVYDAFNMNTLMSTNILAFLLLTKHRKGATFHQLLMSMDSLRDEIVKRKKSVSFKGDSEDLIRRASNLLGKELITREAIQMEWSSGHVDNNMQIVFYKPNIQLPALLELQYYGNAVLPVFLLDSVVTNAMCSMSSGEFESSLSMKSKPMLRGDVLKHSLELCNILQYEFIFSPPGTSLFSVLNATIDNLISIGLLHTAEESEQKDTDLYDMFGASGNNNSLLLEEEESELLMQGIKVNMAEEHISMLHFLTIILRPYIESYWLVSCSLQNLIEKETEESLFLQQVRKSGQKKLQIGELCYEECVGLDCLKNALKLFESWKIIKNSMKNSQKVLTLYPSFSDKTSLIDMSNRIKQYKR